jgi:hypothetical protein
MAFVGMRFELGSCVMTEFDEDGFLKAQPEGLGLDARVASSYAHHPYGFISRPLDPGVDADGKAIQGQGCTILIGKIGDERHIWFCGDPRPIELLPVIGKGESMMYGPAANFARCKADGTVTMFTTTDGTYDGQSVYCEVAPDGVTALTPWGKLQLGANGFHVLHASGARMDLGAIAGLPAPLDSLGSYVKLAADIVQIEAAALSLGSASGLPDPLAKATATLAGFSAIATAFTAEASAFTALAGSPALSAPIQTACGAAATALGAAVSALGALTTTLPASSTAAS